MAGDRVAGSRKPVVLVTGASRGLGFELARQYRADGCEVIATCRGPRPGFLPLDVADESSIAGLADRLRDATIDVLVNNAGVLGDTRGLAGLESGGFLDVIRANTLGPLLMVKAFLPMLRRSPRPVVANISSRVGTVAGLDPDGDYAYCASKAALNMLTAKLALDHRDVIFLALHPGWVKTDMGGPGAKVDAAVSALGLRRIIAGANPQNSGTFRTYDGKTLPW